MTLWGDQPDDDMLLVQKKPRRPISVAASNHHIGGSCLIYGHSWEYFGITGLKRCVVCQINGYCPGCTPTPPLATTQPFYCTAHTQGGQDDVSVH